MKGSNEETNHIFNPYFAFSKAIKIDEILTEKNHIKFDFTILYANIKKKEKVLAPITYQTLNGDYVNIPTYIGNSKTNQDYINYGFSFKYGFSKKLELFSNINFYSSDTHISDSSFYTKHKKGFNNLNIGFTYEIKKEDEKPSILIGTSIDLIERAKFSNYKKDLSFKSYSIFATSYYTVDPIVFLINTNYRIHKTKSYKNESINNGNIFILAPSIYFAVNPYTSINWGFKYEYKAKDKLNNEVVSNSGSNISYIFGINYEISSKDSLNLDFEKKDTNDYTSSNINFSLSHKF